MAVGLAVVGAGVGLAVVGLAVVGCGSNQEKRPKLKDAEKMNFDMI